ncbi:MAG: MarR family transcriptional regulator [Streptomyces sp.]|uniref:MarR family winged helix-turn-helix transcriptional regulator n=1 Tax=Streptomyces sp. TaxID=1931 RepID=UPI0025D65B5C|nr:MarR family transcriptional regulator [Streptomyces sp.]MBW8799085.1 MarR family transcriptional regulator [Streptomyces sp.]
MSSAEELSTSGGTGKAEDDVQAPARLRALTSWQANKVSTAGARMTARHMPLTARADFAVLAALEEYGPLSQADLGRRLGLDRNDVSGIVKRLESGGHVDRHADPEDRRRNVVTVNRAGLHHLDELQSHADQAQAELLAGLNADERRQLHALLAKTLEAHRHEPA